MKTSIMTVCCLVIGIFTQAQNLAGFSAAEVQQISAVSPLFAGESVKSLSINPRNLPGQHGIRTGKTLTIIGSVLLVGGVALVSTADELYYNSTTTNGTTTESGDIKGGLGVVLIAGGVGMIIPGVIIWAKNKKRYNQYLMEHPQQSLNLHLGGNKVGIAYRF